MNGIKMPSNILLLSIRPKYAKKIFEGNKKVELRRVRTRLDNGDLVLVYASSPQKALIGSFEVDSILEIPIQKFPEDLNKIWNKVSEKAEISRQEFDIYYAGASLCVCIFFKNVELLPNPVNLTRLREEFSDFRPPQSYHYLT
ncbi:ASCH domain-containing protein [Scytonema sp. PCC 10023]|uniref:ASCH domain-containing protein n=1 Tax=Scytonema sp. PCC 10023 TaxID=1680591 RepID=UPI0039C6A7B5